MLFCKIGEYFNNKFFLFKLILSNISYIGVLNGYIVFKISGFEIKVKCKNW